MWSRRVPASEGDQAVWRCCEVTDGTGITCQSKHHVPALATETETHVGAVRVQIPVNNEDSRQRLDGHSGPRHRQSGGNTYQQGRPDQWDDRHLEDAADRQMWQQRICGDQRYV
jgi:hypothetical protein